MAINLLPDEEGRSFSWRARFLVGMLSVGSVSLPATGVYLGSGFILEDRLAATSASGGLTALRFLPGVSVVASSKDGTGFVLPRVITGDRGLAGVAIEALLDSALRSTGAFLRDRPAIDGGGLVASGLEFLSVIGVGAITLVSGESRSLPLSFSSSTLGGVASLRTAPGIGRSTTAGKCGVGWWRHLEAMYSEGMVIA